MSSSKSTGKAEEVKAVKAEESNAAEKPAGRKAAKAQGESKRGPKKADQAEAKAGKKTQKKTAEVKKNDKPELKPDVYIQYGNLQIMEAAIVDKVKASYVNDGHRVSSIKALQVYIKPEESKAYYVINDGKFKGEVSLW